MSTPTPTSLAEAEVQRSHSRSNERTTRIDASTNLTQEFVNSLTGEEHTGVMLATVANAEILAGNLTINTDYVCPISLLIPEDAVIFGGSVYERASAEGIIRESMTKRLTRWDEGNRVVKDPLKPSRIIYLRSDRLPVHDESEIVTIVDSLLTDVDTAWYNNLKIEVDCARSANTTTHQTTDGESKMIIRFLFYFSA